MLVYLYVTIFRLKICGVVFNDALLNLSYATDKENGDIPVPNYVITFKRKHFLIFNFSREMPGNRSTLLQSSKKTPKEAGR